MSRFTVPAAFAALGLIWGSSFMWIKIAVDELPAATVVAQRLTIGSVAMLAFMAVIRMPLPRSARELVPLAVIGMLNAADARLVIGTVLVLMGIGVVSLRYDAAVRRAARGRNA